MNAANFLRLVQAVPSAEGAEGNGQPTLGEANEALSNAKASLARRREREKLFGDARLIAGPAWEMLVDLYVNQLEGKCLCIGSVCVTSGVPMTNAVRILTKLIDKGHVERNADPLDGRRCVLSLNEQVRAKMDLYFSS